jgi:hypothetical protein
MVADAKNPVYVRTVVGHVASGWLTTRPEPSLSSLVPICFNIDEFPAAAGNRSEAGRLLKAVSVQALEEWSVSIR